jgi:hypothetical protein
MKILLALTAAADLGRGSDREDLEPLRERGVIAGAFDRGAHLARDRTETRAVDQEEIALASSRPSAAARCRG